VTWVKWKLVSVRFGDNVNLDTRWVHGFAQNLQYAQKSFCVQPMELLGDVGQVKASFGLFGCCVNLDTRCVHNLPRTYHRLKNHFVHTRCYSYVTWIKWKGVLVHLEIVLISTQDRCSVCTKRTNGWKIFKGASDGAPW
jgi:hypothetical protein